MKPAVHPPIKKTVRKKARLHGYVHSRQASWHAKPRKATADSLVSGEVEVAGGGHLIFTHARELRLFFLRYEILLDDRVRVSALWRSTALRIDRTRSRSLESSGCIASMPSSPKIPTVPKRRAMEARCISIRWPLCVRMGWFGYASRYAAP